jgi:phosphoacetylglucosamine mutase
MVTNVKLSHVRIIYLVPLSNIIVTDLALSRTSYSSSPTTTTASSSSQTNKKLIVDCACGVGHPSIECFNMVLNEVVSPAMPPPTTTTFQPINGPKDGILNENCGSEYVLKVRGPPKDYAAVLASNSWEYAASFDGDADRIAFFGGTNDDCFVFDGDKITTIVCDFLQAEVAALKKACESSPTLSKQSMTLGAVQTAYANGASTKYLQSVLGDGNVLIAKTGVRHCHHAAKEFDIGVYFEANGHGTVVFGPQFYSYLSQAESYFMEKGRPRPKSLFRLRVLPSLINQTVGDALSDLLLVDAILHIKGWNLQKWNSLYNDLPSRMTKLKVKNRSVVETNENDTICLAPTGVQDELNSAMAEFGGRCFVRPSGTEDVVRVYAEAPTTEACHKLSAKAELIVYELCGGVGDPPQ